MPAIHLNADARRENIRALMAAAGLPEEAAAERLDTAVVVTLPEDHSPAEKLRSEVVPILSRTLAVSPNPPDPNRAVAAEIVLGPASQATSAIGVFVSVSAAGLAISRHPISGAVCETIHPLKALLAASYISGAAIRAAVGQGMPNPPPDPLIIYFSDLVPDELDLDNVYNVGEVYLAGVGAIGNGFLWAARHVHLVGLLHVVDDDFVSKGNLQRQVWFDEGDIDEPKAVRLAEKAQGQMPGLKLLPKQCRLQDHPNRTDGPWLRRLIVAVDSRPARRSLQNELPGEVFDASTSGSHEIVLHHNLQPNPGACLGCIYPRDEREVSHEQVVAHHLGVDASMLQMERINDAAAELICARYPQLNSAQIVGLAFDTLYKQLCSADQLKTPEGAQVIAPFAFISVLAGAMLLIEVLCHLSGKRDQTNDWRLNPWMPPVVALRCRRARRSNCECCGRPEIDRVNRTFWSVQEAG